jgi:copper homeostasis protein
MIRPHAENFFYEKVDLDTMKISMNSLKLHGADGFVFGILNRFPHKAHDGTEHWIDVPRNIELVRLAEGRPCTFHRAFDLIPELHWATALADILECGFTSILTNGGPSGTKAAECTDKLANLVAWKYPMWKAGDRQHSRPPEIIVGGGVRSSNIHMLQDMTGASAFHSAALLDSSEWVSQNEVWKMKSLITSGGT